MRSELRPRRICSAVLVAVLLPALLAACSSHEVVDVPSANQNGRVRYLVIHHTSEDFAKSLALLTQASDNPVSAHYLVPESGDESYPGKSLKVYRLVPESRRAWHAGRSYWNGEEALNDHSIGIELVNKTYCVTSDAGTAPDTEAEKLCFFPDFAEQQLALTFELVAEILRRHPDIAPTAIVGHADVAPDRKVDPGPRFPWQRLYRLGVGAWHDDDTVLKYWNHFLEAPPELSLIQRALHDYGYKIEISGIPDRQTMLALRAFQMHFRPMLANGEIDAESAAILFALIEKYRPEKLQALLEVSTAAAPSDDDTASNAVN